jgi:hypothetical protein
MNNLINDKRFHQLIDGHFQNGDELRFVIHSSGYSYEGFRCNVTVYDARDIVRDTDTVRVEFEITPVNSDDRLLLVVGFMRKEDKKIIVEIPVLIGQDLFDNSNTEYTFDNTGIVECPQSGTTTFHLSV